MTSLEQTISEPKQPTPGMTFGDRLEAALTPARQGDYLQGIENLIRLDREAPDQPDLLGHLANLARTTRRYDLAVEALARFTQLRPEDANAWFQLGTSRLALGDRRGAAAAYRRVWGLNATFEDVEYRLRILDRFPSGIQIKSLPGPSALLRGLCQAERRRGLFSALRTLRSSRPVIRSLGWFVYFDYLKRLYLNSEDYRQPIDPCDGCGGRDFTPRFFFENQKSVSCNRCGLCFVERRPPDGFDVGRAFYEREETIESFETTWWHDPKIMAGRTDLLKESFAQAGLAFPGKGSRTFEVGCAQGHVLAVLREEGLEVEGLETSGKLVDFARRQFGLKVECGVLGTWFPKASTYDLLLAYHVLEHLDRPSLFFEKAREMLKPGGFVLVEVPVPDLPTLPLADQLDPCSGYPSLGHMHYFTADSMKLYLERFHFRVVHTYQIPIPLPHGGFLAVKE